METHPKKEHSLVIVKPDGVQRALLGEIISRFERTGLKFIAMKLIVPKAEQCWTHYNKDEEWFLKKGTQEQWWMSYSYQNRHWKMRLGFTAFKHVGIFPEQAQNWNYIIDTLGGMLIAKSSVLNLFAYTGGASLAARAAGAEVSHVDSVKQVITWSRENMEASGLQDIRWVCEDALKFVKREQKRAKKYNGIILDPPAYGTGANGEKWVLEENLKEILKICFELLDKKNSFLVLNLYSMGFSALVAETLMNNISKDFFSEKHFGELFLKDGFDKKLPLGVFWRGLRREP